MTRNPNGYGYRYEDRNRYSFMGMGIRCLNSTRNSSINISRPAGDGLEGRKRQGAASGLHGSALQVCSRSTRAFPAPHLRPGAMHRAARQGDCWSLAATGQQCLQIVCLITINR